MGGVEPAITGDTLYNRDASGIECSRRGDRYSVVIAR
jgi:hypothetical protein